jgi:hypothetical protein
MTVEQMVREVLDVVAADAHLSESLAAGAAPQSFTAGELVGPANRLAAMLVAVEGRAKAAERARIERAVGDFWDCSEVENDPAAACDKLLAAIRQSPSS